MRQISELLKKLREENTTISLFLLGYLYENGSIVSKDLNKAHACYKQAAELSEYDSLENRYGLLAAYNMWVLQISGNVLIPYEKQKTPLWVELAEEDDDGEFLFRAGVMYEFGIGFEQNYTKAIEYYESAEDLFPDAALRLGLLSERGLGCEIDLEKANEYYQNVDRDDCELADIFLREDLYSIWPTESWIHQDVLGEIGEKYQKTSLGFDKLYQLVAAYERHDVSNWPTLEMDPDIERWFKTLVHTGIANNVYNVGKKLLDTLNEFFNKNSGYLSDSILGLPFYARSSSTVESYVKLYLCTNAWLTRAKHAGSTEAIATLRLLLEHKNRVEVGCGVVFQKYASKTAEDEKLWQRTTVLISLEQKRIIEGLTSIETIPNKDMRELLEGSINELDIEHYVMWSSLIYDFSEKTRMDRSFFDKAVNSDDGYTARQFIEECNFDINYLVDEKNMSPVEYLISEGFTETLADVLCRGDVDVNFNVPIFMAISCENVDCVRILLEHPLIDLGIKKHVGAGLMSIEEAVNRNKNSEIKLLVKKIVSQKQEMFNSEAIGHLYFKYKDQDAVDNVSQQNNLPSLTTKKMYYQ